jgi:hypothetical protein
MGFADRADGARDLPFHQLVHRPDEIAPLTHPGFPDGLCPGAGGQVGPAGLVAAARRSRPGSAGSSRNGRARPDDAGSSAADRVASLKPPPNAVAHLAANGRNPGAKHLPTVMLVVFANVLICSHGHGYD